MTEKARYIIIEVASAAITIVVETYRKLHKKGKEGK